MGISQMGEKGHGDQLQAGCRKEKLGGGEMGKEALTRNGGT